MAPAILQRSISYTLSEAIQGMLSPSSSSSSLHSAAQDQHSSSYYECDGNGFALFSVKNDFNNNGSIKRNKSTFSLKKQTSLILKLSEANFKVRCAYFDFQITYL